MLYSPEKTVILDFYSTSIATIAAENIPPQLHASMVREEVSLLEVEAVDAVPLGHIFVYFHEQK